MEDFTTYKERQGREIQKSVNTLWKSVEKGNQRATEYKAVLQWIAGKTVELRDICRRAKQGSVPSEIRIVVCALRQTKVHNNWTPSAIVDH